MGDSDRENERERKLFLGGLNYATNEDTLKEFFSKWGNLVDVVVMRFPDTKRSRGFGFITFETKEEADQCFEERPHVIDEANIETKRATPRDRDGGRGGGNNQGGGRGGGSNQMPEQGAPFGSLEAHRKLFVGGLDYATTDESLKEYFSAFGELNDCVVMKFRDTKRSRGFGFITFSDVSCVDTVQNARPHTVDGAKVETKRATPRDNQGGGNGGGGENQGANTKKVFLGGLKDAHTDEALEEYFSNFGKIVNLEQLMDKSTGRKRGFGFVEFDDYDPVDKLMLQPGHNVANYRLDVKRAVSKEDMRGPPMGGGGGGRGGMGGGRGGGEGGYAPWAGGRDQGGYGQGGGAPFGGGGGGQWGQQQQQGGAGGYGFNSAFGGRGGGQQQGGGGNPNPWGGAGSWEDQGGWGYQGGQEGAAAGFGGGYGRAGGNAGGGGGGAMRNQMSNRSAPYNVAGNGRGGAANNYGGGYGGPPPAARGGMHGGAPGGGQGGW